MTYEISNWQKQNLNLTDVGICFPLCVNELNDEAKAYIGQDKGTLLIDAFDIDEILKLDSNASPDFANADYDELYADTFFSELIKPADHYLVFAHGCRWDGASGYYLAESIKDAIRRSYDAAIYPQEISKGGKTLVCREYSHDVPMGSKTVIIALTDREYANLENSSYEQVEAFANRHSAKC